MSRGHHQSEEHQQLLGPLESALSCLWVVTPVAATASLVLVLVAMLTNQWLHTEEKMNNPAYNGTGDKDYLSKMTVSGLWMLCFTNPGETLYECVKIDYFTKEEYSPDPNDSTLAIPYSVTKSVCFFAVASGLLTAAYCCCLLGTCSKHRGLYTFASGVAFVISGLVMLFGLIMYIAVFKAEIGGKLRPRSHVQPPLFTFRYGYSFLVYVCGFVLTQLAGISSIFLFIYKMQFEYTSKHLDDLRRGHKLLRPNINYVPIDHLACRRHPHSYINSNSLMHVSYAAPCSPSAHQRRYFFSKDAQSSPSACNMHVAEPPLNKDTFYDFPPPPTISYQFDERGQFREMRTFPRDVTSNTISTTADVVVDEFIMPERYEEYGGSHQQHPQHQQHHAPEFVTFDLDQALPLQSSRSSRKDYANDSLRRTTPV